MSFNKYVTCTDIYGSEVSCYILRNQSLKIRHVNLVYKSWIRECPSNDLSLGVL